VVAPVVLPMPGQSSGVLCGVVVVVVVVVVVPDSVLVPVAALAIPYVPAAMPTTMTATTTAFGARISTSFRSGA
jgi:hypothetical protein